MNPWPLWYWCSTLPTELTSQLGAGHYHNVGSCNKPMKWWINDFKYIEIIYVNCGLRNEFGSDLRRNEHYWSKAVLKIRPQFFFKFFFQSCASCATLLLLSHFDVICDLLLQKCKATCHLSLIVTSLLVHCQHSVQFHPNLLLPWETKREFLLTISIQYQPNK